MDTKSKQQRTVLVTGADGFIGRNLIAQLQLDDSVTIKKLTRSNSEKINELCENVDFVFHIAGENRPATIDQFEKTNVGLTKTILACLAAQKRHIGVLLASSTQATHDNPYGVSKKKAEEAVKEYGETTHSPVHIYRLPNVFGKWSRPNYNSVVATFCYNLSHEIPLQINDPDQIVNLVHIDTVVKSFIDCLYSEGHDAEFCTVEPVQQISVGELAETLETFWQSRESKVVPDLSTKFHKALYGTLTSYYDIHQLSVKPEVFSDDRGWLFELIKSKTSGQIFVSSTNPGYTRGDHWHQTKVEKFTVIKGSGVLSFRHIFSDEIIGYPLSDKQIEIVDIPVGYIHAIQNTGENEMIVLFWASEMLDKEAPDTYYEKVIK